MMTARGPRDEHCEAVVVQARLDTTANSLQPGVDENGMAECENLAAGADGKDLSTAGYSARWHWR